MSKTKDQKQSILRALNDKIDRAKSVIFASFDTLTVKENSELRKQLKSEDGEYYVVKKTLLNLAFKDRGVSGLDPKNFSGKIATIFGYGDEVAPAKTVFNFQKDNKDKIDFVGGVLENKLISADEVTVLAKLPGREELYAKIVGSLNAPLSGLVNVFAGNMRQFVCVLKAIEEKKG